MWIDLADAIKIYARMCRARYRSRGAAVILARVEELRRQGDLEGADVFERVARELSALERSGSAAAAVGESPAQSAAANAARTREVPRREVATGQRSTTPSPATTSTQPVGKQPRRTKRLA